MHLTKRVVQGLPGLRRPDVLRLFRELVEDARGRGLETVVFAMMNEHLHWVVIPRSAEALRDATRYVFGRFARRLNRLFGRRGKVFTERYWSSCCRSVRHAWQVLGYVLRNARTAGCFVPRGRFDRFAAADEVTIGADNFLRAVLGPTPALRRTELLRLAAGAAPFVPLAARLQLRLPGL